MGWFWGKGLLVQKFSFLGFSSRNELARSRIKKINIFFVLSPIFRFPLVVSIYGCIAQINFLGCLEVPYKFLCGESTNFFDTPNRFVILFLSLIRKLVTKSDTKMTSLKQVLHQFNLKSFPFYTTPKFNLFIFFHPIIAKNHIISNQFPPPCHI